MGVNTINNIMKNMIKKSPLADITKKVTNHSARKTLVKILKQNQVPKSDIITITGHNNEGGLDAYDSGDEMQQEALSLAIDRVNPPAPQRIGGLINTDDPRIARPTFKIFKADFMHHGSSSGGAQGRTQFRYSAAFFRHFRISEYF